MEEFILRVGKILGNPDGGWGQVHTFTPQEEEKRNLRGQLVAVLSAQGLGSGVGAVEAGREIILRLHEEYFGKTEKSPFEAIKETTRYVGEEFAQKDIDLTIVAQVLWRGFVYISIWGKGRVAIFREGQLAFIEKSVSGKAFLGDIFLLGTRQFFQEIGEGVIRAALETKSVQEAVDQLLPRVHQSPEQAKFAAAVVKLETPLGQQFLLKSTKEKISREPSLTEKIKTTFEKRKTGFGNFVFNVAQRLPQKPIYVKGDNQKKKTAFSVAVILVFLLVLSGVLGFRQRRINLFRASYEGRLLSAEEKLTEAENLSGLNETRARELITQAEIVIEELEEERVKDSRLETLRGRLGQAKGAVLGEYSSSAGLFLDLSVVRDELSGTSMTSTGDEVLVFDKESARLVSFTFEGKNTKVLAGSGEISGGKLSAFYAGHAFVLKEEGIWEISETTKKVVQPQGWGEIILFQAYGGNLYLIDKMNGEIWRYPRILAGFGEKQRWLAEDIKTDFVNTEDMAIDGSIWILDKDGKIRKYTHGAPENLSISGVGGSFVAPVALVTSDTLDYLYVLDPGAGKIFVFDKKGEYKKAIVWQGLKDAKDFVVSEEKGKILILTGSKIYEIKLE